MLSGSLVAIVTPMQPGGALDFPALARLIDFHVAQRHVGNRHRRHDRRIADGRRRRALPADQGSRRSRAPDAFRSSPAPAPTRRREAIELTRLREGRRRRRAACRSCRTTTSRRRKGCTGISARSPKRSTCRWFFTTCRAAPSPISPTETVLRLARSPGHRRHQGRDVRSRRARVDMRSSLPAARDFALYSATTTRRSPLMLLGGHGVISVTANVAPELMAEMCAAALAGDVATARAARTRGCWACIRQLFVEAEPDSRQMGAGRDGLDPKRIAASADAVVAALPRCASRRAARSRLPRRACLEGLLVMQCIDGSTLARARARGRGGSDAGRLRVDGLSRWASASITNRPAPRPSLEMPPDLTTPQYDDRYAVTSASGLAAQNASRPQAVGSARRSTRGRRAHRACRQRALAGREGHAGAGVDTRAQVLAGQRASCIATEQPALGRHGNRLGGEPRGDAAGRVPQVHRQVHRRASTRPTSATSSARGSSAAPSPARSKSTCRIAAWSRCRR